MANYNKSKYIAEAMDSVLTQTFEDWELIIIDDCSTDNSVEVMRKYRHNREIIFLQNKCNVGYIETLRRLTREASADILVILDSDDALTNDALESIERAFDQSPDYGFVYSEFEFCDENLKPIKKGNSKLIPSGKSNLYKTYTIAIRSFRRSCYYLTSGYDDEILYAEDRDIIFKLEEVTKFYFIDKVLYKYRRIPNSQTLDPKKAEISRASHALAKYKAFIRRQNTNVPNLTKAQMSYVLFDAVPSCIKSRDIKRLKFFLVNGFILTPLNIKAYIMLVSRIFKFPFYSMYKNYKK
jgi:glycosyltransferase involved in cell wall biosynthesis